MKNKITSYKKKNGKTFYMFKVYLGIDPLTGKQINPTRRGFKTMKEAQKALNKLVYEFDQGLLKTSSGKTYGDVYELWREVYMTTVKESTLNKTDQVFRDHILPVFENKDIDKITSLQCQRFYNDMVARFDKGRTFYNYANKCFNYAIQPLRLVSYNPFTDIYKTPVKQKTPDLNDKGFLEREELLILLDAFKQDGDIMWHTFFHLLAYSGMRRGEILALKWDDVDFRKNAIKITKTLTLGENNRLMVSSTAKTSKSNRIIDLDPVTMQKLKTWKKEQTIQSLENIVFTNNKGSYIALPKAGQKLDQIYKKHKLSEHIKNVRITPHVLRHSHCCHLFDAGADLKAVQSRLGHEDELTTLKIYNHFTNFRKEKSTEKYFKFMGIFD
ncbi:tyrosine-type recombinase/integrase [Microaceticoccus formicicus]|uniref:site-specific integrase n=1 Tax=Microaceticoccus formicicus TaxID=3118105 RepID=UPI003CD00D6B|nr:site-specific integrase [Peptoniphilaceae bacterium AMB_02]